MRRYRNRPAAVASWHGLLEFLYLPEVLLFLLLASLVVAGAGRASLDARIGRR